MDGKCEGVRFLTRFDTGTNTSAMLNIMNSPWPAISSIFSLQSKDEFICIHKNLARCFPSFTTAVDIAVVTVPPSYRSPEEDSEDGGGAKCRVRIGDTVGNGRLQILGKLGWGQFSTVWFAKDN